MSRAFNLIVLVASVFFPTLVTAMSEMTPEEMSAVNGQGLIISDQIAGAPGSDLTFYRAGLDAKLEMNVNIDKLQLGCGGGNGATGCDIDIDFLSLMGNNSSGEAGVPGSNFSLIRPYFDFAIKDGDSTTLREVVGIKLGSQSADGYMGIGRRYENGINQETGGNCNGGANDIDCHSGLNSFSGYMQFEYSGTVSGDITSPICFLSGGDCGDYNGTFSDVGTVVGTRLGSTTLTTTADTDASVSFIPLNNLEIDVRLIEPLRYIHGLAISGTSDFFISFQKESVDYPVYDHLNANADEKYSDTANAGWWMNFPSGVELSGLAGVKDLPFGDAINGVLGAEITISNIDLGQIPVDNCFGSANFC